MATLTIESFPSDGSHHPGLYTTRASEASWETSDWEDLSHRTAPGDIFALFHQLLRAHQDRTSSETTHEILPECVLPQSPAHAIGLVRDSLSLTVAELGDLFEVSRQAVYDWKKEKTPMGKETWDKLISLAAVAQAWQKMTAGKAPRFLLDDKNRETSEPGILEACRAPAPDWKVIREMMSARWEWYQKSLQQAFDDLGYHSPVQRGALKRPPTAAEKEYAESKATRTDARNTED